MQDDLKNYESIKAGIDSSIGEIVQRMKREPELENQIRDIFNKETASDAAEHIINVVNDDVFDERGYSLIDQDLIHATKSQLGPFLKNYFAENVKESENVIKFVKKDNLLNTEFEQLKINENADWKTFARKATKKAREYSYFHDRSNTWNPKYDNAIAESAIAIFINESEKDKTNKNEKFKKIYLDDRKPIETFSNLFNENKEKRINESEEDSSGLREFAQLVDGSEMLMFELMDIYSDIEKEYHSVAYRHEWDNDEDFEEMQNIAGGEYETQKNEIKELIRQVFDNHHRDRLFVEEYEYETDEDVIEQYLNIVAKKVMDTLKDDWKINATHIHDVDEIMRDANMHMQESFNTPVKKDWIEQGKIWQEKKPQVEENMRDLINTVDQKQINEYSAYASITAKEPLDDPDMIMMDEAEFVVSKIIEMLDKSTTWHNRFMAAKEQSIKTKTNEPIEEFAYELFDAFAKLPIRSHRIKKFIRHHDDFDASDNQDAVLRELTKILLDM